MPSLRVLLFEFRAADRPEADLVADLEEKRTRPIRVVWLPRRAANDVPATGSDGGIDTCLTAGDRNGSRRHLSPGRLAAWRCNARVDFGQVRKPRNEAQHVDAIGPAAVKRHHFIWRTAAKPGDIVEIGR